MWIMRAIQLFIDDTTTNSKYSEYYCTNTLQIQRYKENHIMMRDAVIIRIPPVIVHPLHTLPLQPADSLDVLSWPI